MTRGGSDRIRALECSVKDLKERLEVLDSGWAMGAIVPDASGYAKPYTSEQIALAARRYVDAMGKRFGNCSVLDVRVEPRGAMRLVAISPDGMVQILQNLADIYWPACEARRAATGRGVPLFAPPEEGE